MKKCLMTTAAILFAAGADSILLAATAQAHSIPTNIIQTVAECHLNHTITVWNVEHSQQQGILKSGTTVYVNHRALGSDILHLVGWLPGSNLEDTILPEKGAVPVLLKAVIPASELTCNLQPLSGIPSTEWK